MIQRSFSALACLMAIVFGTACVPMGSGMGGGGGSAGGTCGGDFGTNQAAARIETFLGATAEFEAAANDVQVQLLAACQRMGRSLNMSEAELSGSGTQGMQNVCNAVNQRFRAEMTTVRNAQVQITIAAQPPHCEVSVDAYARCAADCEANIQPGQVDIQCTGGEIRGYCDAQCTGSCAVSVNGSCSGHCEGACNGQCSATNADGSCAGQCNGTCQGQCVASAQASCQGECRGGCSVQYREPYCTGNIQPPQVSAHCDASCDARVDASAHCEPGQLTVVATGNVDSVASHLAMVRGAVQTGLKDIVGLRARVQRLAQSGAVIARLAPQIPRDAATLGVSAVSCATASAAATARAMASVNVSVSVSVSVSASATASGSAG